MRNLESFSKKSYKCEKCSDLTFVFDEDVAIPCECRGVREAESILKQSGISDEFRKKTFDSFDYSRSMDTIEAYKCAVNYYNSFRIKSPSRYYSIMFLGQVGFGKTHLSLAIANKLMEDGVGVVYMGYREAITYIKQHIMDKEVYARVIGRYKRARVLLVDDLFKGSVSSSDVNIMFEIINFRYFNNLPVIVSSEKGVKELLDIDEGIGSRLVEMSKGYLVDVRGKKLNYRIYG